ncbi:hypothetical protein QZN17_05100 [Burkholderia multivorans]|nr:hypothetical protein [Burkholderia multivorans]
MDHSRFDASLFPARCEQSHAFPAVIPTPPIGWLEFGPRDRAVSWVDHWWKVAASAHDFRYMYQCEFPAEPDRIERPSHELGCAPGALPARPYLPHYAPKPRCFACGGEVRADWRCTFCGRDNG